MNEKAKKILALALDKSCSDGEWQNAAIAFIRLLRNSETKAESFLQSATPRYNYQDEIMIRMPFGKHKEQKICDLPKDYLEWLAKLPELKRQLAKAVADELYHRSNL